jgi:hypothetical protein
MGSYRHSDIYGVTNFGIMEFYRHSGIYGVIILGTMGMCTHSSTYDAINFGTMGFYTRLISTVSLVLLEWGCTRTLTSVFPSPLHQRV